MNEHIAYGARFMWQRLIEGESRQFSRAMIYIIFVIVSLIAAAILFGVLQSTGALKLVWHDAGTEAQFAGAFAGFLILLTFLIRSYDRAIRDQTMQLRGNVYLPTGVPAEGALVYVEGIDRQKRTDGTGGFYLEVDDRAEYRVKAVLDQRVGEVSCKKADLRTSVRIALGEPIRRIAGLSSLALVLRQPKGEIQRCALRIGAGQTIGRAPTSDVVLPAYDRSASRRHAIVDVMVDRLRITDAPGRNGTFPNGQKISAADAYPGDVIKCGETRLEIESDLEMSDSTATLGRRSE